MYLRFKKTAFVLGAVSILAAPIIVRAAAGDLDGGFGNSGLVMTDIGGNDDFGWATAIQTDGKIVVVGSSFSGPGFQNDFAIVRYNSDGTLDDDFGSAGKVTTDIGGDADVAQSVAVQSDGKIVVAGHRIVGANWDFAVVRYNPDGTLDTSFDGDTGTGNGIVTTALGGSTEFVSSLALQSDDKIVLVGYTNNGVGDDIALVRFNPDGTLDTSLGGTGIVTTDIGGGNEEARSVAIQSDGKIVLVGYTDLGAETNVAVVRYNIDGSLDTDFAGDGTVTTAVRPDNFGSSVAIQNDGKIVVAGYSLFDTSDFIVLRYNSDGTSDTDFSDDGLVVRDSGTDDFASSMALDDDGRIIVAGYTNGSAPHSFAFLRFNSDGSSDSTFGSEGMSIINVGDVNHSPSIAIQNDQKIIVAGTIFQGGKYDFLVLRLEGRERRPRTRPIRTVALDPSGGMCADHSTAWSVQFRGTYTLPTDCTRVGHVFLGWTRDPALTAPENLITTISRSGTVTAVWGELPTAPSTVNVLANFLCRQNCDSALIAWPTSSSPSDTAVITLDGNETSCSASGETSGLEWCWITGLTPKSTHTTSVAWRNQYGTGPATSAVFDLR